MTVEVKITHLESGAVLGMIRIRNEDTSEDGTTANYSVEYGVERIAGVGASRRAIWNFPRLEYNVLGLLLQALNTLSPEELKLDGKPSSSDMARRLRAIGGEVQSWARFMRHH